MMPISAESFGVIMMIFSSFCSGEELCSSLRRVKSIVEQRLSANCNETLQPPSPKPECSKNWVKFENSCYFFSDHSANFAAAAEICKLKGAHLVYVEKEKENTFLKALMKLKNRKTIGYWMGLTDLAKEGVFQFHGTNRPATYFDWASGEPNNNRGKEDCALFYRMKNYSWNDGTCDDTFLEFICEQDANLE